MKLVFIVTVIVSSVTSYEPIGRFYHKNVGIPKAAAIKAAEEMQLAPRIVGGSYSELGQEPHFAGLLIYLNDNQTSVCGSTLLSSTKVVTAGHCVNDGLFQVAQIEVVLGSINLFGSGTRVLATSVNVHAGYDPLTLANDIAMLTIPTVTFTDNIKPINLPSGAELNEKFVGVTAQAVGYGKTSDSADVTTNQVLSHVDLQVITNCACSSVYGNTVVTRGTICTSGEGGVSICGGDSGGPLSIRNSTGQDVLIGVVSFAASRGCQAELPGGYSRVTAFIPWINTQL